MPLKQSVTSICVAFILTKKQMRRVLDNDAIALASKRQHTLHGILTQEPSIDEVEYHAMFGPNIFITFCGDVTQRDRDTIGEIIEQYIA